MITRTILFSLIAFSMLTAQSPHTYQETNGRSADAAPSAMQNLSLEPIGPGDLIDIYVVGYEEITRGYRVSLEGTVALVGMKQPINVAGLKAEEVEKVVAKLLIDTHWMVDPMVSVSVLEYRSRPVNVAGAVRDPTIIQALGEMTLLDAISRAGGLAPEAGPEIIVSRRDLPGLSGYTRRIAVKDLMAKTDPSLNISLQGGEEIRVPAADKLYIAGNVKAPGAYPLDQAAGLTVLQALALCQGTLSFSQPTAVIYRLVTSGAARLEINIPLRDIMKRRAADVALLPNDILYVPDNSGTRMTAEVFNRITGFGTSVGSGLLIWAGR